MVIVCVYIYVCVGSEYFVEMDLSDEVVDSRGRIFITLLGDINSTEVEFTR